MNYSTILREEYDRLMVHLKERDIVPNDACSKIYVDLLREKVEARYRAEGDNTADSDVPAGVDQDEDSQPDQG